MDLWVQTETFTRWEQGKNSVRVTQIPGNTQELKSNIFQEH